ncbi:MAG TPA: CsbD family protein [Terracidiphilus sp.]|jgi:uncharacterized protein YjbJ (UPF0337 family)
MDKQRVKGAIDDVVGGAKRKVGKLTGNVNTQVEGAAQQIKGKVETAVGKVKDAARNARDNATAQHEANEKARHVHREVIIAEDRNII